MTRSRIVFAGAAALAVVAFASISSIADTGKGAPGAAPAAGFPEPPAALEALYPPNAPAPVYLGRMIQLSMPFAGVMVNLMEGDFANAATSYEKFKAEYAAVSKLVPEWEKDYPLEPVNRLGAALASGDQGKVMAAMDGVGKVCHDCHTLNMPAVHYKYHWKDFKSIQVFDPLLEQDIDFQFFMTALETSFSGIAVNLAEGQVDNARKNYDGLVLRFETLEATCAQCHDTERKYFVDAGSRAVLDQLGEALRASAPNPETVKGLHQKIGMGTCHSCHLVHVPAALTQMAWAEAKGAAH